MKVAVLISQNMQVQLKGKMADSYLTIVTPPTCVTSQHCWATHLLTCS